MCSFYPSLSTVVQNLCLQALTHGDRCLSKVSASVTAGVDLENMLGRRNPA